MVSCGWEGSHKRGIWTIRVEFGKSGQGKSYWNSKFSIKPNKSLLNEAIIFKEKEDI